MQVEEAYSWLPYEALHGTWVHIVSNTGNMKFCSRFLWMVFFFPSPFEVLTVCIQFDSIFALAFSPSAVRNLLAGAVWCGDREREQWILSCNVDYLSLLDGGEMV